MVLSAVVSGLIPAWMATRASIVNVLREEGRGNTGRGIVFVTRGLVVAQVVVTCFLLVGSLLQLRSIVAQQRIDYGYDTNGLMSARLGLMEGDYPAPEARARFYERLARELRESPQYAGAALTSRLRMVGTGASPVEIDGKVYRTRRDRSSASFEQVTGNYFSVMGQKLLDGRTFTDDDLDTKQPVAIVNDAFARKHFGATGAVGRRFRTGDGETGPYGPWRTIVGVVSTVRMTGPFNNPNVDDTGFYVPIFSNPVGPIPDRPAAPQFATILVRPHPGQRPQSLLPAMQKQVNAIDPALPLYFPGTPRRYLDAAVSPLRVIATMFTIFGGIAVALAAVGIYGVVSFSVAQRRKEFGLRMALGANGGAILGMVLRQGARQLAWGLGVGLGLSLLVTTLGRDAIGQVLFGVSAVDPTAFVVVFVLVTSVGLFATLMPARRATRVDPMVALRTE
jgi:predicted permease